MPGLISIVEVGLEVQHLEPAPAEQPGQDVDGEKEAAPEPLVALHVEHDIEMTGGPVRDALTLAGEAQRLAVVDA